MVERSREHHYQRHARNISTVSDISMTERSEPLRRDQSTDIKCIILCDSMTETHLVFEAFNKAITDPQSEIQDAKVVHVVNAHY